MSDILLGSLVMSMIPFLISVHTGSVGFGEASATVVEFTDGCVEGTFLTSVVTSSATTVN